MNTLGFQLKRLAYASPLTLAFLLFPFVSLAVDVKEVPNLRKLNGTWVTDMAEMLDEQTEAQLNSAISQLERKNGTEIAVVTVPETAPATSTKAFTTALFNYWGIGKKNQDNGVLFLISKGERRVEIETGHGIAKILPNASVSTIINTQILPRFTQGDINGGTLAGTKALVVALEAPQTITSQTVSATQTSAFSQEVIQDDAFPWLPLVGGGVFVGGGLVLAMAATNYVRRRQRQSVLKQSGHTSKASSYGYSQTPSNVYSRSSHVEVEVDVDVDIDTSDENDWSYQVDSCDHSSEDNISSSFGGGSSDGDGAGSNYSSNLISDTSSSWNSDSSSGSSYDSSDSNWSSDTSSSTWSSDNSSSWNSDSSSGSSYDSSSTSDFGGGSSDGDGGGSNW